MVLLLALISPSQKRVLLCRLRCRCLCSDAAAAEDEEDAVETLAAVVVTAVEEEEAEPETCLPLASKLTVLERGRRILDVGRCCCCCCSCCCCRTLSWPVRLLSKAEAGEARAAKGVN